MPSTPNSNRLQCSYRNCTKTFLQKAILERHEKSHQGPNPYPCQLPDCKQVFQHPWELEQHQDKEHSVTNEKPNLLNVGDFLDNVYSAEYVLQGSSDVSKKTPLHCGFANCKKVFYTRRNLVEHICTHTGEKPLKCDECGKAFRQFRTLNNHLRTHNGERPFQCSFPNCPETFTQYSSRQAHERIHTELKPFACDYDPRICRETFRQAAHLQAHLRTHTRERPFSCKNSGCDKTFTTSSNARRHTWICSNGHT
ncbi:hypothetical protein BC833DRAFT_612162 [Globomyces pollinis-pini]|nr:hypothetical protein BC833DRAFT_612162 [Globomyces pollinis-pini]